jgi:hypothetical protein
MENTIAGTVMNVPAFTALQTYTEKYQNFSQVKNPLHIDNPEDFD